MSSITSPGHMRRDSTRNGPAARRGKGHPRRTARRVRAAARAAAHTCVATCRRFRLGREEFGS